MRDLSALLDNTLLFSRIAGTRDGGDALKFRDVTAGEILPPIFERITERLDRAGTDFDTNVSDAATADVPVLTLTAEIVARLRRKLEGVARIRSLYGNGYALEIGDGQADGR